MDGGVLCIGFILGCVWGVFRGVFTEVSDGTVLLSRCWPAPCLDWSELEVSAANWPSLASLEDVGRSARSSDVKSDIMAGELQKPWGKRLYLNCWPEGELNAKKSLEFGSSWHDSNALNMSNAEYILCFSNKARLAGTEPVKRLSARTLLLRTLRSAQKRYSGVVWPGLRFLATLI